MPVQVVRCDTPGKGAAVREGMRHTTADLVGYMDADCATDLEALQDAVLLSSRRAPTSRSGHGRCPGSVTTERHSQVRALGATLYRRCTRQVAPGIADTQCGFKVLRGDLARAVFADPRATGFSFDVEVLGRAQRRGARIVEFPVDWDDVPGSTFLPARHGAVGVLGAGRHRAAAPAGRHAVARAPTGGPRLRRPSLAPAVEA